MRRVKIAADIASLWFVAFTVCSGVPDPLDLKRFVNGLTVAGLPLLAAIPFLLFPILERTYKHVVGTYARLSVLPLTSALCSLVLVVWPAVVLSDSFQERVFGDEHGAAFFGLLYGFFGGMLGLYFAAFVKGISVRSTATPKQ